MRSHGGHVTGVGTVHGNVDISTTGDSVSRVVFFTCFYSQQAVGGSSSLMQCDAFVREKNRIQSIITCLKPHVLICCCCFLICKVVNVKKLQGTTMKVSTEHGSLQVKAIYAESICVSSCSGRVELGHVHGEQTAASTSFPLKKLIHGKRGASVPSEISAE